MVTQSATSAPEWTWVVPLVVALVAFTGVMITVMLQWRNFSKQVKSAHSLKIAEMRQAWINNLRDVMSKFQSYGVTPGLDHTSMRELYEYGTRIELMMNPEDPDYAELQECLYEFLPARSIEEKYSANPRYVDICQRILKREWEVLKKELKTSS